MRDAFTRMVEIFRLDLMLQLGLATLLGGVIGLEREFKSKPAGLRTNILICIGSVLYTHLSLAMLTAGPLGFGLAGIEHRSGSIGDQRRMDDLIDESLEPRHECSAIVDRARVNGHVELTQVRFSRGGKQPDDVGTECSTAQNPSEKLDDQREAVAFVASSRFFAAQRLQRTGERLLGSGGG